MRTYLNFAGVALVALLLGNNAIAADDDLAKACEEQANALQAERVTACETLIDQGRGSRDDITDAMYNRAEALAWVGENEASLAGFEAVLERRPADPESTSVMGFVYRALADTDKALAHYDKAVKLRGSSGDYVARGQTRMLAGDFSGGASDLRNARTMEGGAEAYGAIWLDIAERRAGMEGFLVSLDQAGIDATSWPAELARHLMGDLSLRALHALANNDSPIVAREQRCEADFYAAELLLIQNRAAQAVPLFKSAAAECPAYYIEKGSALTELKRLGL